MYEKEAMRFMEAIRKIAQKEENMNNMESYLTYHFPKWLKENANTPEGLVKEMEFFADLEF